MKRKGLKKFNISNKLAYTLIVILSIVLIGVGVYAYGGTSPSTTGHSLGELASPSGCTSGQSLTWNGNSWTCASPSGIDKRFTISAGGFCYTAPEKCELIAGNCINYQYTSVLGGSDCSGYTAGMLSTICNGKCYQDFGYPCNGQDPTGNCAGGQLVSYTGTGYCEGGGDIECICSVSQSYYVATYIPAHLRCITSN